MHVRMWAVCLASFFFLQCLSALAQAPSSPACERLSNARGKEVQVRLKWGELEQLSIALAAFHNARNGSS